MVTPLSKVFCFYNLVSFWCGNNTSLKSAILGKLKGDLRIEGAEQLGEEGLGRRGGREGRWKRSKIG